MNSPTVMLETPLQVTISIPVDRRRFGLLFTSELFAELSPKTKQNLDIHDLCDPNWLIRILVKRARAIIFASEEGKRWVNQKHTLDLKVIRHKKEAHMVNGTEFVVPRCNTDRPAFIIKREWALSNLETDLGTDSEELIHGYCCMSQVHAHPDQQVLLFKCLHYISGVSLLNAAVELLEIDFFSDLVKSNMPETQKKPCTPAEAKKTFTELAAKTGLISKAFPFSLSRLDQTSPALQRAMQSAVEASTAAHILDFLLWLNCPHLDTMYGIGYQGWSPPRHAVNDAAESSNSSHAQEDEPDVFTTNPWASPIARTPASVVAGHQNGLWKGKMLVGTLDNAAHEQWLRWAKVTHIVNCLPAYNASREPAPEMNCAMSSRFRWIYYTEWIPKIDWIQRHHWDVFHKIQNALNDSQNCVLIYCKSGKDQSIFMIFSFLRMYHYKEIHDCKQLLSSRKDIHGVPLALEQLENRQDSRLMQWLQSAILQRDQYDRPPPLTTVGWSDGAYPPKRRRIERYSTVF